MTAVLKVTAGETLQFLWKCLLVPYNISKQLVESLYNKNGFVKKHNGGSVDSKKG